MMKISLVWKRSFFDCLFFAGLLAGAPVYAQTAKNFYEGKAISYLVGSTAGGGNDITSRHIARHLERHIPGKPRNVPGRYIVSSARG